MTAVAEAAILTEAGVYEIAEDVYHADPVPGGSLSSSGARKLLPPSCPARFRHERDHPPASTPSMERGTAAHRLVLGTGAEIVQVDAADWRTKAAQDERDKARADGKVPLLAAECRKVQDMAATTQVLQAMGLTEAGGLTVSQISLRFTEDDLMGKTQDLIDPEIRRTGLRNAEFFWEVVEARPTGPAPAPRGGERAR